MTDEKATGKLPATSRELGVYRKKPPSKSLLERLDALNSKH
jgi:hypothetical protein